jgi:hypothetical protein
MKTTLYKLSILTGLALMITSCEEQVVNKEPVLKTLTAVSADITTTTAKLKGEVTSVGNMTIIEYGIELSKSQLFSSPLSQSISGAPAVGVFEVNFTGLEANTKYYYKAYALINTARVYSGTYENFTTKQ